MLSGVEAQSFVVSPFDSAQGGKNTAQGEISFHHGVPVQKSQATRSTKIELSNFSSWAVVSIVMIPLLVIRGTRGELINSSDDWIAKFLRIWYGQSSDECGDSTSVY